MGSKETLEFLAGYLVDYPDEVVVEESRSGTSVIYDLFVHPDDLGRVIGRRGRTAKAIRTVVRAAAAKEDRHVVVEIAD